jgi:hypothetical protein
MSYNLVKLLHDLVKAFRKYSLYMLMSEGGHI